MAGSCGGVTDWTGAGAAAGTGGGTGGDAGGGVKDAAGGGVKGGVTHGSTDDFGYHAVKDPVSIADFHATVLHLLGLDYERLSYRHGARDERLTDVNPAKVVKNILA